MNQIETTLNAIKNIQSFCFKSLVIAMSFLISLPTAAMIPERIQATQTSDSKELDLAYFQQLVEIANAQPKFRGEDYIPLNLSPTANGEDLAGRIIGHSLNNWMKSPQAQNLYITNLVRRIEAPLRTEMSFGGSSPSDVSANAPGASGSELLSPMRTQHKVKFNVDAGSTQARIQYEGLMNAEMIYAVAGQQFEFRVTQKLSETSQLVLNHVSVPDESREMLSLQMSF